MKAGLILIKSCHDTVWLSDSSRGIFKKIQRKYKSFTNIGRAVTFQM